MYDEPYFYDCPRCNGDGYFSEFDAETGGYYEVKCFTCKGEKGIWVTNNERRRVDRAQEQTKPRV